MYIISNGQTYPGVRVFGSAESVQILGTLSGRPGEEIAVYADNGFLLRTIQTADYARQEITDGSWLLTNRPERSTAAEPVVYELLTSTANMVRLMMQGKGAETDDEKIRVSALWPEWAAGNHTAGEVYNADGAPWECYQSYDNATHPDIAPGGSAWQTFNRPLHGTSRETARYFVQPTGAHDIYRAGEWMIFDRKFYECLQNTAYSPADYAQAWEKRE